VNNERYIELIHGEIDGTNSPNETRVLQRLLGHDDEAREFHGDMKQLTEILDRVEDADLPKGLRDQIRSEISARPAVQPAVAPRRWTPGSALRISVALAAGLILGLLIGPRLLDPGQTWDPADFSGAMTSGSRVTDPVEIDLDGFSATIHGVQNGDRILVSYDISSETPVEVELTYDPGKIDLTGFVRRGGRFDVIQARDGRFIIEGDHEFRGNLLFERIDPATTSLRLQARRNGSVIGEDLLSLDGSR
jgi:anti-sigma factor RsiW